MDTLQLYIHYIFSLLQSPDEAIQQITNLLKEKRYWEACEHMHNAVEIFQEHNEFQ